MNIIILKGLKIKKGFLLLKQPGKKGRNLNENNMWNNTLE